MITIAESFHYSFKKQTMDDKKGSMKATGLAFAVASLGITVAIVLKRTIYSLESYSFSDFFADAVLFVTVGFAVCASSLTMLLLNRPRSAALIAGLVLVIAAFVLRDQTIASVSPISRGLLQPWITPVVPPRFLFGAALVHIAVGLTCLVLSLDRRRDGRDSHVALILATAIALAAQALVTLAAGLAGSSLALVAMAAGLALLVGAVIALGRRRDAAVMSHPRLWLPVLLAVAITTSDLLLMRSGATRWGYVLIVACGLLFSQRSFVRVLTIVATGLAVFGAVASQRGDTASLAGLIGAILLAYGLVDRHLQIRQAHRDLTERFAAIQQMTGTACFELDLTDMTFASSPAFDALHGRTAHEGTDWRSFVATHIPAEQQSGLAASLSAAQHGRTVAPFAYRFQRRDGETGDALLRWVPTCDAHGRIAGLTGMVQDVTLQHGCERGNAELRAKLYDAQKLEMLGLLAGGVAHDLSNTLVPVGILAPLVLDTITDPTDRQSMELIIESAQRARELARAMLAYTREEPTALERVRLDDLVRDSLGLLRARVPTDVTIVDALAPVPAIEGNMCQLYQVVLNLTVNAAQAIGSRGGTITIGTMAEPRGDKRARSVRLFVADDGVGIRPETLDRIFEPFFSSKDGDEASGIGLAIVRRIVQTHAGVISAKSNLGQGARFDLLFPVAPPVSDLSAPDLPLSTLASEVLWQSAST